MICNMLKTCWIFGKFSVAYKHEKLYKGNFILLIGEPEGDFVNILRVINCIKAGPLCIEICKGSTVIFC